MIAKISIGVDGYPLIYLQVNKDHQEDVVREGYTKVYETLNGALRIAYTNLGISKSRQWYFPEYFDEELCHVNQLEENIYMVYCRSQQETQIDEDVLKLAEKLIKQELAKCPTIS